MRVGILSDTHDHWPNIDQVAAYLRSKNIQTLAHCGDVCAPLSLVHLTEVFPGEIHYVLGNVDGDPFLMVERTRDLERVHHHGKELGQLKIGNLRIALQHYPKLARGLAMTGEYDAVFYGHNHIQCLEYLPVAGKEVLLANPGTLSRMDRNPSFGIYDSNQNSIELLALENLGKY